MLTTRLDRGLETISSWSVHDEVHLPPAGRARPVFDGQTRALAQVLDLPTLDQRTSELLTFSDFDKDLALKDILASTLAAIMDRIGRDVVHRDPQAASGIAALQQELAGCQAWHTEAADKIHESVLKA